MVASAMYNKLKNNTEGIRHDARVDENGTNWEDAVEDKDRWISRTIQLEDDFSAYDGMVTTLAASELNTSSYSRDLGGGRKAGGHGCYANSGS